MVLFNMTNTALILVAFFRNMTVIKIKNCSISPKLCLLWKQVGHFIEKRYLTGNSNQAYMNNPLDRKMRLHWKWHSHLQSILLNLFLKGK